MKAIKLFSTLFVATLALTACGGGGGSGGYSTGGTYLSFSQIAQDFVYRVNLDVPGYNLTLVKDNTLQYDWIVVYDNVVGSYYAYDLGGYQVGQDVGSYIYDNPGVSVYQNSDGATYTDPITGAVFKKTAATGKNLAIMKALKQNLVVKGTAANLQADLGLTESKAMDVAKLHYFLANGGTLTDAQMDTAVKNITGSSITEFEADAKSGDNADLQARINKAATITGMGPEKTQELIKSIFGK